MVDVGIHDVDCKCIRVSNQAVEEEDCATWKYWIDHRLAGEDDPLTNSMRKESKDTRDVPVDSCITCAWHGLQKVISTPE